MGAVRSKRFAMVVEDMKVTYIGVETQYVPSLLHSTLLPAPDMSLNNSSLNTVSMLTVVFCL